MMKNNMLRLLPLLTIVLTLQLALTACHTVSGIGRDVEAAGETVEEKAERHRGY